MSNTSVSKNPTLDFYGHLDDAFVFFNKRLFGDSLPKIMFELTNKKQVCGFFKAASWQATDGVYVHSIVINPQIIVQSTPLVIYITLVKEMVHLWQKTYGKASRPGYHNTEWAEKMESIGLMPSSTGHPGGKKVGQKMSSYLIAGGAFEAAAVDFFLEGNFMHLVDATIDDADVLKLRNSLLLDCVKKNQSLTEYYQGWQSKAIEYDATRKSSEILKIDVNDYDLNVTSNKHYKQPVVESIASEKIENSALEPERALRIKPNDSSKIIEKDKDGDFDLIDSFLGGLDKGKNMGQFSHESKLDCCDALPLNNDVTHKHVFDNALSHLVTEPLDSMAEIVGVPPKPKYDFNKTKYQCSTCKSNVWGKPSMKILCVDCNSIFDTAN